MTRPNWLIEEPAEIYHSKAGLTVSGDSFAGNNKGCSEVSSRVSALPPERYLSSHLLADFRKCPKLFEKKVAGLIRDCDSSAYLEGRAAHSLILEGRDVFDAEFITNASAPKSPTTGKVYRSNAKEYKEWAAENSDKSIIKQETMTEIELMAESVLSHAVAGNLVRGGFAEGVCRGKYCGADCQIRIDYYKPEVGIVDLKTTADLDRFPYDCQKFGYAYQLAFYRAVLREVSGGEAPQDVHIVAVEKTEPYRCGVWKIAESVLDYCEEQNLEAIERLKSCQASSIWPTGYELPRVYEVI